MLPAAVHVGRCCVVKAIPRGGRYAPRRIVALAGAFRSLIVLEVGVRALRLPRLCALLGIRLTPVGTGSAAPASGAVSASGEFSDLALSSREQAALRSADTVLRRGPFQDTCLRRALCAGWILRRHQPELWIGVKKAGGTVSAHAWLVVDGLHLDPAGPAAFAALVKS